MGFPIWPILGLILPYQYFRFFCTWLSHSELHILSPCRPHTKFGNHGDCWYHIFIPNQSQKFGFWQIEGSLITSFIMESNTESNLSQFTISKIFNQFLILKWNKLKKTKVRLKSNGPIRPSLTKMLKFRWQILTLSPTHLEILDRFSRKKSFSHGQY